MGIIKDGKTLSEERYRKLDIYELEHKLAVAQFTDLVLVIIIIILVIIIIFK